MADFKKFTEICFKQKWDEEKDGDIGNISLAESLFWLTYLGDFILFGDPNTEKGMLWSREEGDKLPEWWTHSQFVDLPQETLQMYETLVLIYNPQFYTRFDLLHERTQKIVVEWRRAITTNKKEEAKNAVTDLIKEQSARLCYGIVNSAILFQNPQALCDLAGNYFVREGFLSLKKRYFSSKEILDMLEDLDKKTSILEKINRIGELRAMKVRSLPLITKYTSDKNPPQE